MTHSLLGHVERYFGVEDPHIEVQEAIHILGEEGDVVGPVDELHGKSSF